MDPLTLEAGNQAACLQELFPAVVVAAVITQVWISFRERAQRSARQQAALDAIDCEFNEIVLSLNDFWSKVKEAGNESDRDALVKFCASPYPEGSVAAWVSSLRTLLPILPTDQIREKIAWLYAVDALNMLRKCLVGDYERFCLYEKSLNFEDADVTWEAQNLQATWTQAQISRLREYESVLERLQSMRSKILSRQCNSI